MVYVGSEDYHLYALDATTGVLLWSDVTGGAVNSSPAVAHGVVYFSAEDYYAYAVNASTGALLWSYALGNYPDSGLAVANGVVYVTQNYGTTTALNASTGIRLWSYDIPLPFSPSVVNGMVYVGDNQSSYVYAFGLK